VGHVGYHSRIATSVDPVENRLAGAIPILLSRLRARRIRKWDERDRRRSDASANMPKAWGAIALLGRGLIGAGLLLFGFVAYQLWGTGIETARAQRALSAEFEQLLVETPTEPTTPPAIDPEVPETPETTIAPRVVGLGDPLARLEIPRIAVDDIVVVGVGSAELQLGPGHFPDTVPPGHLGNAAIAGHRTSYGQPFRNVDRLELGDEIRATTPEGSFTYRVTQTRIVSPSDYFVVFTTDPNQAQLTLVSCHPVWSTAQRIIVSATLVSEESSPVLEPRRYQVLDPASAPSEFSPPVEASIATTTIAPVVDTVPERAPFPDGPPIPIATIAPVAPGPSDVSTVTADAEITDAFADGWFHDRDAFPQIVLWGTLLILISVIAHRISVWLRRDLVGFGLAVVPFFVTLYFFYQNIQRLVPPGL
jgi:sortase A